LDTERKITISIKQIAVVLSYIIEVLWLAVYVITGMVGLVISIILIAGSIIGFADKAESIIMTKIIAVTLVIRFLGYIGSKVGNKIVVPFRDRWEKKADTEAEEIIEGLEEETNSIGEYSRSGAMGAMYLSMVLMIIISAIVAYIFFF
jgi:hypothetical protein